MSADPMKPPKGLGLARHFPRSLHLVFALLLCLLLAGLAGTFMVRLFLKAIEPSYERLGQYLVVRGGLRATHTEVYFLPKANAVGRHPPIASTEDIRGYIPLVADLHLHRVRKNWVIGETPRDGWVAIDTAAEPHISIVSAMCREELERLVEGTQRFRIVVLPWQERRNLLCALVEHKGVIANAGVLEFVIDGRVFHRVHAVSGDCDILYPVVFPIPERSAPLLMFAQMISDGGQIVALTQVVKLQPTQQMWGLLFSDVARSGFGFRELIAEPHFVEGGYEYWTADRRCKVLIQNDERSTTEAAAGLMLLDSGIAVRVCRNISMLKVTERNWKTLWKRRVMTKVGITCLKSQSSVYSPMGDESEEFDQVILDESGSP